LSYRAANGRLVPVQLRRHPRARRFILRVGRGVIKLTIPTKAAPRDGLAWLERERAFVEQQLAQGGNAVPFAFGTSFPVLGRELPILPLKSGRARITTQGIEVSDPAQCKRLIKQAALEALTEETEAFWARLGVPSSTVAVRDMTSRWGSCRSDGKTVYQWRLAFAPTDVLRYVAAHEAAHRVEMNHGPRFWDTVEDLLPGHAVSRAWLRRNGESLFRFGREF
jgi:predicted metal-dependent hydrolase